MLSHLISQPAQVCPKRLIHSKDTAMIQTIQGYGVSLLRTRDSMPIDFLLVTTSHVFYLGTVEEREVVSG